LTGFVNDFLQDSAIFFDLTEAERDGMEKKWIKPWLSSKLKKANKPAGLRIKGDRICLIFLFLQMIRK
jgi:hypothetical protein